MTTANVGRGKSKVAAGVLAILLGWLGIHHFYLGSVGAGIVELLLSCIGIGWLLAVVEGILLLIMSDAEFDARYNQRSPETLEFVFIKPATLPPPA